MEGIVKFYDSAKAYGFIIDIETNAEYFVHRSKLISDDIKKGDHVVFKVEEGPKGPQAAEVWKKETK